MGWEQQEGCAPYLTLYKCLLLGSSEAYRPPLNYSCGVFYLRSRDLLKFCNFLVCNRCIHLLFNKYLSEDWAFF